MVRLAGHLLDDCAKQFVAGVAVTIRVAWFDSRFRHRAAKVGVGADDIGVGRPRAARQDLFDAVIVIEIADTGGMIQQLPNGHPRTKSGNQRKMLADRIVELEFTLLGKHQNA